MDGCLNIDGGFDWPCVGRTVALFVSRHPRLYGRLKVVRVSPGGHYNLHAADIGCTRALW